MRCALPGELIAATCARAVRLGVTVGAQVGYPDREGFGRRPIEFEPADLADEIRRQIDHLADVAWQVGADVAYVKPHGALYHRIIHDPVQARAVRDAVGGLPLMGMAGTLPAGLPPGPRGRTGALTCCCCSSVASTMRSAASPPP